MTPVKLCALCQQPRTMQGSKLTMINGYKRWVHTHCATNSKESNK